MITLITGTPGAGKTLYTISKLLLGLVGTTVKQEVDGETREYPRTIYTNIRGLMIDHEFIDGSNTGGLRNWHEWAKPGAIIVFDEIQKVWTPRANGSAVPPDIQALETHRHMGVDFILITQGLMLTERNLAMLCNRHLHVRRVGNMPFAIVYEWDHASRTLMYAKSVSKSPWRYDKKVFKLYKSSDLHTKQKRSIPGLVWFVLAGIVAMVIMGPTVMQRMNARMNPTQAAEQAKKDQPSGTTPATGSAVASGPVQEKFIDDRIAWVPRISSRPESAPAYDELRKVAVMPVVAGAICNSKGCRCVTQQGTSAGLSDAECRTWLDNPPFDAYSAPKQVEATQVSAMLQNGAVAPSGPSPTLVVIDAPGRRDPQGAQGSVKR